MVCATCLFETIDRFGLNVQWLQYAECLCKLQADCDWILILQHHAESSFASSIVNTDQLGQFRA